MMFRAPPEIGTEVFARIPDRFRRPGGVARERILAGKSTPQTDCYIEGPSFDRAGNLWLVDIAFGRIFRVSPSGETDLIAEYDGEPNGLKIRADGVILIADHKRGLLRLDPGSGAVTPLHERRYTENFRGLNDLWFARNGDLYVTDQGQTGLQDPTGRVLRLDATGRIESLLNNVPSPNGILMNEAETMLYVAVTRANQVWRAQRLPDGTVTRVGAFIQMSGGSGPDGMAMDEAGNLAVAHAGMGAVWLFSRRGEPVLRVNSCQGEQTTNIAYGGVDRRSLFITESHSGCVLLARMPEPGVVLHSHRADVACHPWFPEQTP